MDNKIKIGIAVIVVIILIAVCVIAFRNNDSEPTNSNTVENVTNTVENKIENEVKNEVVENVVENSVSKQNVVENQKLDTKDLSATVYEDKTEAGTLAKKQEAINLVKEKWGEDDSVTFSCDSITSNGIYIIAVTSKEKAEVLNYFRVDLTTKTVTVDY